MNSQIKEKLLKQILKKLDQQIDSSLLEVDSIRESRNSETKSSAGDKFETGRAMAQMELEKMEAALARSMKLKEDLSKINIQKEYTKVEYGSLIITNVGNYLACFALGKVRHDGMDYYAISLASPIGQVIVGKKPGDRVLFQGREIEILKII